MQTALSFDFYVPQYNTCIEYQGVQHYKPVERFGGEEQFAIQQEHDELKRKYAKNNNFDLLESSLKEVGITLTSKELEQFDTYYEKWIATIFK